MDSTKTIVRNTAFVLAAQLALRVINPVFNIFVTRQFGDALFGEYSVLLTWVTIFSVIGDMGVTQFMSREISRDREGALHLFWDVTALRFILAVIATLVTVVGAILWGFDETIIWGAVIYCLSYFFQAVITPLTGILMGYERLDVLSVLGVLAQLIYIAVGAVVLLVAPHYLWLLVASLVNLPIAIVILLFLVKRYQMQPPPFALNPGRWWSLIVAGFPFGINQVSLTLAYRFDTLLLASYVTNAAIGWYNAAYNLSRALTTFAVAFSSALLPTLARQHSQNPESVRRWYYGSFRLVLFTGFPLAVGGALLADKIIPMLYGGDFEAASIVFAILVWDTLLLMYTSLCGNIAQAIKQEGAAARIFGVEAFFNLALNIILIPQYGIIAAAFVTLGTELAGALLFYRLFRREFGAGLGLRGVLRFVLSGVVMGGVVYLLRDMSMMLVIPIGAVVYLVAIGLTQALNSEERAMLGKVLRRIPGLKRA
jgi:O-antigen/teichoic acid export membrane protein